MIASCQCTAGAITSFLICRTLGVNCHYNKNDSHDMLIAFFLVKHSNSSVRRRKRPNTQLLNLNWKIRLIKRDQSQKVGNENGKHYKGVRRRPWGKFAVEIWDPTKNSGRVCLGTFATTEDAAIVYDRAVYRMCGSRALLNFSLRVNSRELEPVWRTSKRRKTSPANSSEDQYPTKRINVEV
ncbi:hypothetical protein M8C21_011270 [Ambrosia artemisiifolia]|uniref:AP2/ERF domain-containing protein n=1 Tax=Ambrosia artemisiifolia TaxID=4212 RepID=A0AAD5CMP6_AMBAR|nr:hypothetical protein M8C21_011270 [Ambrosia artemisiifolia]